MRRKYPHPLSEDPSDFEPDEVMEHDEPDEPEEPPVDYDAIDDEMEARAERYFHGE